MRYLRSRLGRSWDAVYSEFSKRLRPHNAVQQHLRDHLDDYIDQHVKLVDGRPHVIVGGALRAIPRRRSPVRERNPDVKIGGDRLHYERIAGAWFEVELTLVSSEQRSDTPFYDVVLRQTLDFRKGSHSSRLEKQHGCPSRPLHRASRCDSSYRWWSPPTSRKAITRPSSLP